MRWAEGDFDEDEDEDEDNDENDDDDEGNEGVWPGSDGVDEEDEDDEDEEEEIVVPRAVAGSKGRGRTTVPAPRVGQTAGKTVGRKKEGGITVKSGVRR